jgi:quercetin dioxygenase-like cupin family protein
MSVKASTPIAYRVDSAIAETLDVVGATVQFLSPPEQGELAPCVLRGTIPPRGIVPMHSHADPETFIAVAGEVEGLVHSGEAFQWVPVAPGDVFHVPGGVKHAWRNESAEAAVSLIVSTAKIGRFFREIGTPLAAGSTVAGPPSEDAIKHFLETSERYGYWNATPEENAAVGLEPPAPAAAGPV